MNETARKHPHVKNAAALAAASVVAAGVIAPALPLSSWTRVVERQLRLVAEEASLANVPLNFFQDLVNAPTNEVGALQQLGESLIFSGPWWAASATNIWGEDPGDPGHFMSVVDTMLPFPQLTGQGLGELEGFDGTDPSQISAADIAAGHMGLSQQIALFMDAEIPVSATSDADWSAPLFPVSPITGSGGLDRDLWSLAIITGNQKLPLINNWFQTPTSDLTNGGYNFGTVADPSAGVGPNGAVPGDGVFLGTHPAIDPTTGEQALNANDHPINLMPWSNLDFKFDPGWSFQHFFQSLEAPVDPSTYAQGFDPLSLTDLGRAMQTLTAGSIIAFDPDVPGSFSCPGGPCSQPAWDTMPALVQDVDKMWPGNTAIENWLKLESQTSTAPTGGSLGATNAATNHQVAVDQAYSQSSAQTYDFGNPSPADPPSGPLGVDTPAPFAVSPQMQELIDFMHTSGVQNFFQTLANESGYTPVDYASTWGSAADPAGVAAGSSDSWSQLLSDLGLDATPGQGAMFLDGLANIASFGIF